MPVYVHLISTPLTEGRSERGLEYRYTCAWAHIYTRECAHTRTHHAVASKEKILNIVKKYYKVVEGKY